METDKICAFWHKNQFGNVVIKFEKGPIIGYVNCLNDGKYQFIVTPEFKFNKTLFSHILAKFGIILTESTNLQDSFNKYLYKCVTINDIAANISMMLTPLNKKGSILTNFVEVLTPYNLFIGTLLQKENGFKINNEAILTYCMKNEILTKDDKPNILQFWRLLFETFDSSDFEKMKIKVETHEDPKVEVKVEAEVKVETHEDPKVEVKVETREEPKIEVEDEVVEVEDEVEDEVEVEVEVEVEAEDEIETCEEPQQNIQLTVDECKLLIFSSETTGSSWASHILGTSIQYTNKNQQIIDAITLIQKILVYYNQKDFNVTRVLFNKYY